MASRKLSKAVHKPYRRARLEPSYDQDFYAWSHGQARALRAQNAEALDWENLAEEIESLGKSDRREVRSRLIVILTHLLKRQYQPAKQSRSWKLSLLTQRHDSGDVLADSPSLRRALPELLEEAYESARELSMYEMGLNKCDSNIPPKENPFTLEQVLDENYLP
jgi:hypothetical protein